jgi:hypothetical protein
MAWNMSVVFLVFILLITTVVPEVYGQTVKSLYVVPRKENRNIHVFEATETRSLVSDPAGIWNSDSLTGHNLRKRSAVSETNITTSVSFLFCQEWYVV